MIVKASCMGPLMFREFTNAGLGDICEKMIDFEKL